MFARSVVLALALAMIARHLAAPASASAVPPVPILMYHYISTNPNGPADPARTRLSVPPDDFLAQLLYLRAAGYTTLSLDELVAAWQGQATLPPKPVVLTFDDGYADFYTGAFPLLLALGDKATIYVISGKVGTPGYLSWDHLRVLAAYPIITIGAHTRHHVGLARLPAARAWDEIAGGRLDLELSLRLPVHHMAYPGGSNDAQARSLTQAAGFLTAVTTRHGLAANLDRPFELPRIRITGGMSLRQFAEALAGGLPGGPSLGADSPDGSAAPVAPHPHE
jgi:peptidoglycan/xylan/chitin deacetylase (PgdA/CDA1 family)